MLVNQILDFLEQIKAILELFDDIFKSGKVTELLTDQFQGLDCLLGEDSLFHTK